MGEPLAINAPTSRDAIPLTLARWRHRDAEVQFEPSDGVCVVLILSASPRVARMTHGTWLYRQNQVGLITVTDPEDVTRFQIQGLADVFKMYLTRAELERTLTLSQLSSIRWRFNEAVREIERCAYRALAALHDGDGLNTLLLSSIALRLSLGLIGQPPVENSSMKGGLSPWQVNVVKELIASRVSEPERSSPSLGEMAAEVHLSLHHFAREFRRTVGSSPHAYMLRQRLEAAQSLLAYSHVPVSEVGRRTGFLSPAHFANRFRREMGVTPSDFRRLVQS